jgi:hypothetical protein
MIEFFKKLLSGTSTATPAETPAPYKVEAPVVEAKKPSVKTATTRTPKIQGDKKSAVKAKTARKPRAPKA